MAAKVNINDNFSNFLFIIKGFFFVTLVQASGSTCIRQNAPKGEIKLFVRDKETKKAIPQGFWINNED